MNKGSNVHATIAFKDTRKLRNAHNVTPYIPYNVGECYGVTFVFIEKFLSKILAKQEEKPQ